MRDQREEKNEIAVFGGGCFWCTEAVFAELRGVMTVESGYAGARVESPTYEQVSSGQTGHAEVIQVTYNPEEISYENLLEVFFAAHDPTTLNQQGSDMGTQYRSLILYADDIQKRTAEEYIRKLATSGQYKNSIVTEVRPLEKFYPAESYHQDFYERNKDHPYCELVIDPKLDKLRAKFSKLLK